MSDVIIFSILVRTAAAAGIDVVPLPGVSAATAALSVSGLPTDRFTFIGFPEKKAGKRAKQLADLANRRETLIFYESPQRVVALLQALHKQMGDRPAVLAREMTKHYEEFVRGTITDIIGELEERSMVKGECTLLVAGKLAEDPVDVNVIRAAITRLLASGETGTGEIAKQVARRFNMPKKTVYALVLEAKEET